MNSNTNSASERLSPADGSVIAVQTSGGIETRVRVGGKTHQLNPCPHCGELPYVLEGAIRWTVECENPACDINPKSARGADAGQAIWYWNMKNFAATQKEEATTLPSSGDSRERPALNSQNEKLSA